MRKRSIGRIGSLIACIAVCLGAGCIDSVKDGINQGISDAFADAADQLVTNVLTALGPRP